MSYKLKVIKDSPIAFWPLDELYTSSYATYSYDVAKLYDEPIYYNSGSGYSAYPSDISGCGNNGTYNGDFPLNDYILPLVSGGQYGTNITDQGYISFPVTKDYYGSTASGGLADIDTSDNDFSFEVWFYPSITTTNTTPIFADSTNSIGLFYESGSLIFKLGTESLYYFLNNNSKVVYVVCVYSVNSMSLYVDGKLVASKGLNSFTFTNSSLSLSAGPTLSSSDYFIIDAPAVYRYSLTEDKISDHYIAGINSINPIQIVAPDKGYLFPTHEENLRKIFTYSYSPEKMASFVTSDAYYNKTEGYISFYQTSTAQSKTLTIYDIIQIPSSLPIVSSKVEWLADKNITVYTGTDGTNYTQCTNGSYIPQYNKETTITNGTLFIKIIITTSDASKYLPKFSDFKIKFYGTKDVLSSNSGLSIASTSEYSLASFNYPALLRYKYDGLKTSSTGGFKIASTESISSVEMLYTPSALTASTLLNNTSANYSWNSSGVISKTNIASIYVNGINKTSETSVANIFQADRIYHIIMTFTTGISGDIKFNYNVSGGPSNQFNNIALYPSQLTTTQISNHYSDYIGRPYTSVSDNSITLTDEGVQTYNYDWIVIRSV